MQRCRGVEVKRAIGAEVQRCSGADGQRCRGVEVQSMTSIHMAPHPMGAFFDLSVSDALWLCAFRGEPLADGGLLRRRASVGYNELAAGASAWSL